MSSRVVNFSAGPSMLPPEVLAEAQAEFLDFRGTGMSLIEMSHRGKVYTAVHEEAADRFAAVLGIPDDFEVLLLQGGATLQFSMVPMNLLHGRQAGYVASGAWAAKAIADAGVYGDAYVAWDGEPHGYARMPRRGEVEVRPGTRYLHVTSNETIGGTQMWDWPEANVPLVGDMSSDIASRRIPWDRFDLVYAGAQKNLGPSGLTVVAIRKSALEGTRRDLGAYLGYRGHAAAGSMLNPPPVFAIYLMGKVMRWIESQGGIDAMEQSARKKAAVLYDAIDGSDGFYRGPVDTASRSLMNVVFRLPDEEAEAAFLAGAGAAGLVNLEGHRSVGGVRASLYNAMPIAGVEALAGFMASFRAASA